MKPFSKACVFLLLILTGQGSWKAQAPFFDQLSQEDGLPSNQVYHLLQDQEGYLWFATDGGVSRYDGFNFRNFGPADGLEDPEVLRLFLDSQNRIWMLNNTGKVARYQDGTIVDGRQDGLLAQLQFRGPVVAGYEDRRGWIWLGGLKGEVAVIKDNEVGMAYPAAGTGTSILGFWEEGDSVWALSPDVYLPWEEIPLRFLKPRPGMPGGTNRFFIQRDPEGEYFANGSNQEIWRLGKNSLELALPGRQKRFTLRGWYLDHEGRAWMSSFGNGVQRFPYQGSHWHPEPDWQFLQDREISNIFQDREGGIWFTSLREGVFRWSNEQVWGYQWEDPEWNAIQQLVVLPDGQIMGGSQGGVVFPVQSKEVAPRVHFTGKSATNIAGMLFHEGALWVGTRRTPLVKLDWPFVGGPYVEENHFRFGSKAIEDVVEIPGGKLFFPGSNKDIAPRRAGGVWVASTYGVGGLEDGVAGPRGWWVVRDRASAILESSQGVLWMAIRNGLYRYRDGILEEQVLPQQEGEIFAEGEAALTINDIFELPDGKLLLGTQGKGLLSFDPETMEWGQTVDEICSFNCRNMSLDGEGRLWVATAEGLSQLRFNATWDRIEEHYCWTRDDGLPSDNISSVMAHQGTIWLGTSRGVAYLDFTQPAPKPVAPAVFLTRVMVNGQVQEMDEAMVFSSSENNLGFRFRGLSFRDKALAYQFRLIGQDSTWRLTEQGEVWVAALPAGDYRFEVRARNKYGQISPVKGISFKIRKAFWTTNVFRLGVLSLGGALVFSIFAIRARVRRRAIQLENRALMSEQAALQAQMNPHFLFNTLNSVQNFINSNDAYAANLYLAQFSDLVRRALNHSRKTSVSLEEEINTLKIYLGLESLRFKERFSYTLNLEPEIDQIEVRFPPLLLQPLIENSMKHGLLHLEGPGKLHLDFRKQGEFLICVVEDNGIGREAARQLRRGSLHPGKPSLGISLVEERLDLLQTRYRQAFSLEVEDLKDEEGNGTGTRFFVKIPIDWDPE